MNDKDRQHLIQNIAGNLGNAKSAEIKARQRTFFSFFFFLSYLKPYLTPFQSPYLLR